MPQIFYWPLRSASVTALTVVAVLGWASVAASAAEPLPADIPTSSMMVSELVKQSALAAERIENVGERINLLATTLYSMRGMSPEELQPVQVLLSREVAKPENQDLIYQRIGYLQPEILLQFARQLPEGPRREHALGYLVSSLSDTDVARQCLHEIKDPSRYVVALLFFACRAKDLNEAKQCLSEIERRGWPPSYNSRPQFYGSALERFVSEHFDEVVSYIRAELPADAAKETLGNIARNLELFKKQPDVAARIRILIAPPTIPESFDAANATKLLLSGYAKREPQKALKIFDEYVAPTVKGQEEFSVLASLAPAGIDEVVKRAEGIATAIHWHKHLLIGQVLMRCTTFVGPEAVLEWLRDSPPSVTRDTSIEFVASHLEVWWKSPVIREVNAKKLVDDLSSLLLQIGSPFNRRKASEHVIGLAKQTETDVPQALQDEFLRLFREEASRRDEDDRRSEISRVYELLPVELQLEAMERDFSTSELQTRANLVRRASLSPDQKTAWFVEFLGESQKIVDPGQRANALSGLGGDLWEHEPERALPLLWESLTLARQLKLKPVAPNLDDGPGYHGYHYPPTDADEALGPVSSSPEGNEQRRTEALWNFARKFDDQEDRDAVLELLGKRLVARKEYDKATGIANLIGSRLRAARLFAATAAAQSGKIQAD